MDKNCAMTLMYFVCLCSLIHSTKSKCAQRKKPFNEFVAVVDRVCSSCRPGEYVDQFCTTNKTNKCLFCPAGYHMTRWNMCRLCDKCTECPAKLMLTEQTPCIPTADRTCKCRDGWYRKKKRRGECTRHRKCRPGHGVTRMGTSTRDVRCSKCAQGFFQPNFSSTARCSLHQICEYAIKIDGNSKRDNICSHPSPQTTALIIPLNPTESTSSDHTLGSVALAISPLEYGVFTDDVIHIPTVPARDANEGGRVDSQPVTDKPVLITGIARPSGTSDNETNINLVVGITSALIGLCLLVIMTLVCCPNFKASPCRQSHVRTASTPDRSVNDGRCRPILKAGVVLCDVFLFLAENIPLDSKDLFYGYLKVSRSAIEEVQYPTSEGPTTEKYKVLLKWQQQYGKLASLDALLNALDSLKLQDVKDKLVTEYCLESPVENSIWV